MNNTTFGLTMLLVGMGGTLVTLWVLTLLLRLLTWLFPEVDEGPRTGGDDHA